MIYELGILTTGTASGAAALELRAGSGRPMRVQEFGVFLNAATASIMRCGRPGNTPAGGTAQVATNPSDLSSTTASVGGIILSGWTTAPTVPAAGNTMRMVAEPAAIGNGMVWAWVPNSFLVSPTTSLGWVLWNEQLNAATRSYVKWDE